jgi:hypothetical protein
MIHPTRASAMALLILISFTAPIRAENGSDPEKIGEFDSWATFTYVANEGKVCYASTRPTGSVSTPKNAKRDPAFFLVSTMPARKIRAEVSTIIGYPFKENSPVKLTIDGHDFDMYTKGDTAWVAAGTDPKVVAAMKAGQAMTVKGTSWRGTQTEDTYSLAGLSAALAAAEKACK